MLPAAIAVATFGFIGAFGSVLLTITLKSSDHRRRHLWRLDERDDCGPHRVLQQRERAGGLRGVAQHAPTASLSASPKTPAWTSPTTSPVRTKITDSWLSQATTFTSAIDSETGSARITSKAEILNVDNGIRSLPSPATGSDVVQDIPLTSVTR